MLKLAARTAKIGNAINSRAELHGDESVTALDIPITGLMLSQGELDELLEDPHAHKALFNRKGQNLVEPMFPQLKPFQLQAKIEDATVTITHGVDRISVTIKRCKLAKIRLEPKVGGYTELSCVVQSTPDFTDAITHLLERLNATVEVEIDGGQHGAQKSLLDNQQAENADPDEDEEGEDEVVEAFENAAQPAELNDAEQGFSTEEASAQNTASQAEPTERELAEKLEADYHQPARKPRARRSNYASRIA